MDLGPMEEVLSAGIRELLVKSLQSSGADLHHLEAEDVEVEVFFVAHSLSSYLSLVALNSDLLGPQDRELSRFQITPEQREAADYFSAHTAGFYFLANQIGCCNSHELPLRRKVMHIRAQLPAREHRPHRQSPTGVASVSFT